MKPERDAFQERRSLFQTELLNSSIRFGPFTSYVIRVRHAGVHVRQRSLSLRVHLPLVIVATNDNSSHETSSAGQFLYLIEGLNASSNRCRALESMWWAVAPQLFRMKEVDVYKFSTTGLVLPPHVIQVGLPKSTRLFVKVGCARSESTG